MVDSSLKDLRTEAQAMLLAGLSVIPIPIPWEDPRESKPLNFAWKEFQASRMTADQVNDHFAKCFGVAIVCGAISGNLMVLDFDDPGYYDSWIELCTNFEVPLCDLVIERTINGGAHVFFRSENVKKNQKLVTKKIEGESKTMIETRGEGGIIYCNPTPGYELVQGSFNEIPTISSELERKLFELVHAHQSETVDSTNQPQKKRSKVKGQNLPGNFYNEITEWGSILEPLGHRKCRSKGPLDYWTRKGKKSGVSMVTGLGDLGKDLLYVHSTNVENLPPGTYDKFGVYARTSFGGDFAKAALAIAKEYGLEPTGDRKSSGQRGLQNSSSDDGTEDPFTELYNAKILLDRAKGAFKFCQELGGWQVHDGKRFVCDPIGMKIRASYLEMIEELRHEAEKSSDESAKKFRTWLQKSSTSQKMRSAIELLQALPGVAVSAVDFDQDPLQINVQNGCVNLRTGELTAHSPEQMQTQVCNAAFLGLPAQPARDCPNFLKVLEQQFGDSPETIEWILGYAGYSLTGLTNEAIFAFIYGEANAGKSKLTEAIEYVLGTYAARLPIQSLIETFKSNSIPSDIATLNAKRFVLAVEAPGGKQFNASLVKSLVGENYIRTRNLYSTWFNMRITFKLWITGNDRPAFRDFDSAIQRRTRIVPFCNPIPPDKRDPKLGEKLIAEADGILTLLVQHCLEWQAEGLEASKLMNETLQEYEMESDPVKLFVSEYFLPKPGNVMYFNKVYMHYQRFCDEQKIKLLSKQNFSQRLKKTEVYDGMERDSKGDRVLKDWHIDEPFSP